MVDCHGFRKIYNIKKDENFGRLFAKFILKYPFFFLNLISQQKFLNFSPLAFPSIKQRTSSYVTTDSLPF
jgi:hypothetical protein